MTITLGEWWVKFIADTLLFACLFNRIGAVRRKLRELRR